MPDTFHLSFESVAEAGFPPGVHVEAQMPFGGIWGVEEFTELRWITLQDGDLHYPI